MSKEVHVCPVCKGACTVLASIYAENDPLTVSREKCRSCDGRGIVVIKDDASNDPPCTRPEPPRPSPFPGVNVRDLPEAIIPLGDKKIPISTKGGIAPPGTMGIV